MLILSSLLATNIFPIIGYSLESNQLVSDNRRVEESKETSTLDRLTESSQIQESSENSSTTDSKETTDKEESEELIKQPLENAPTYRVGLPDDPNIISIDKIFSTTYRYQHVHIGKREAIATESSREVSKRSYLVKQ